MNPNYVHTITLYSCLKAKDSADKKEKWVRTVLRNCFYKAEMTEVQNGVEATKTNAYTVRIPQNSNYCPYSIWKDLVIKDIKGVFTVTEGDIVVLGECTDEITGVSPDTAVEILRRYKPDAFRVSAFADNTSHRMGKHYRLGG